MNCKPGFLSVFNSQLFLIAGNELCIIDLKKAEQHLFEIESSSVVQVHPTVLTYQDSSKNEVG